MLKETIEPTGLFGTMPQEPWRPGKGTKPDRVIQLKCGEVRTHASYKTTRTWEKFNNEGTKIILLSDELWLIANNSKSFANGNKSIMRNNLGLCKCSEIYLFRTFKSIVMNLMVKNIDLARKDISNKLMIFNSNRKRRRKKVIPMV